ncbi:TPA: hypothetical protein ACSTL5_002209 [Serratia fonticola]
MALPWIFSPDWAEGVTERLEWLTDILTSPAGVEQCRALRRSPRRTWSAAFILQGTARTQFTLMLARNGAQPWLLPVWPDVQWVSLASGQTLINCQTDGRDFIAGGRVLVLADNGPGYEVLTVQQVAPGGLTLTGAVVGNWPYARLYPVRSARLTDQPQASRVTDDLMSFSAEFIAVEDCDWPVTDMAASYRGFPVLTEQPDAAEDVTAQYQRLLLVLDNSVNYPQIIDTANMAFIAQSYRWQLFGSVERATWRSLFYRLRGRQGRIWIPSFNQDFSLVSDIPAGNTLQVQYVGFSEYSDLAKPGQRDLQITCYDGRTYHARITAARIATASSEYLTLDQTLPAIPSAAVASISFMALSRLAEDRVELIHFSDNDGVAESQAVFRSVLMPSDEATL